MGAGPSRPGARTDPDEFGVRVGVRVGVPKIPDSSQRRRKSRRGETPRRHWSKRSSVGMSGKSLWWRCRDLNPRTSSRCPSVTVTKGRKSEGFRPSLFHSNPARAGDRRAVRRKSRRKSGLKR